MRSGRVVGQALDLRVWVSRASSRYPGDGLGFLPVSPPGDSLRPDPPAG
jgi:hypothetical protein